jgi:carboxypeptidase family protein
MNLKIRLLLLFFLVILFPVLFGGTVLAAGFKVTGTAIDGKNDPIARATITATDVTTQKVVSTTTSDQNGYYTLYVPKGTYDITTDPPSGSGLQPTVTSHIAISSDISLHSNMNTIGNGSNASVSTTQQVSVKRWIGLGLFGALLIVIISAAGFAFFKKK